MLFGIGTSPRGPAYAMCGNYGAYDLNVKASGNNVYLLWQYDGPSAGNTTKHELLFKSSSDYGKSFSQIQILYHMDRSSCSIYPDLTAQDNHVYVLYNDNDTLYFIASNNSGESFGQTMAIGKGIVGEEGKVSDVVHGAQLLANGSSIYVMWNQDTSYIDREIMFRRSTDFGHTLDKPIQLSAQGYDSVNPEMAIAKGSIYVSWTVDPLCELQSLGNCDSDVMYTMSKDSGQLFSKAVSIEELTNTRLLEGPLSTHTFTDTIAAKDNTVYLTWMRNGIYYITKSIDSGQTFEAPVNISDYANSSLFFVERVYPFNHIVYLVGMNMTPGSESLLILKSDDGTSHFQVIPKNGSFPVDSWGDQIAFQSNDRISLLWQTSSKRQAITVDTIDSNGQTINGPIDLYSNQNSSSVSETHLVSNNNNVYVFWLNNTYGYPPSSKLSQQIIMSASIDGGKTFSHMANVQQIETLPEFDSTSLAVLSAILALPIAIYRLRKKCN